MFFEGGFDMDNESKKLKAVEVFFADLRREKQQELLEALGLKGPDEGNFELVPLAVLEFEAES